MVVYEDHFDGIFEYGDPKYVHGFYGGGVDAAEADEFDKQDFIVGGESDDPEVFFFLVDDVFAQQHFLHDGVDIFGVYNFDFLLVGEFDVHGLFGIGWGIGLEYVRCGLLSVRVG